MATEPKRKEGEKSKIKQRKMNARYLYHGFFPSVRSLLTFISKHDNVESTMQNSIRESFGVIKNDVNSILHMPKSFVFIFANQMK